MDVEGLTAGLSSALVDVEGVAAGLSSALVDVEGVAAGLSSALVDVGSGELWPVVLSHGAEVLESSYSNCST